MKLSELNNNKYRYDGIFDRFDGVHYLDNDSHHDLYNIWLYFVYDGIQSIDTHNDIQFIDVHDDYIQ